VADENRDADGDESEHDACDVDESRCESGGALPSEPEPYGRDDKEEEADRHQAIAPLGMLSGQAHDFGELLAGLLGHPGEDDAHGEATDDEPPVRGTPLGHAHQQDQAQRAEGEQHHGCMDNEGMQRKAAKGIRHSAMLPLLARVTAM